MKDNVKLGDKKILQNAKLDLEGILKNNPGNYTDLEKEKFKRRIEENPLWRQMEAVKRNLS